MSNNVEGLMGVSVDKIRDMVDANTVVGTPMALPKPEGDEWDLLVKE